MRCWGLGATGALGQGDTMNVGDDEVPSSVPVIDVGGTLVMQHSDGIHACALLETGGVRCWGLGTYGMLGYAAVESIGDDELPAAAGDGPLF
jgi:hypothetical protein